LRRLLVGRRSKMSVVDGRGELTAMADNARNCDAGRLRRLLDGTLEERDEVPLVVHLSECEECQNTLETLAAKDLRWGSLRAFLGEHIPRMTRCPLFLPMKGINGNGTTRGEPEETVSHPPRQKSVDAVRGSSPGGDVASDTV
jgi:hypothetical protein